MKNKIVNIFVCMLLITTSIVLVKNDGIVIAEETPEEPGPINGLDYTYMWKVINKLANIIHDEGVYGQNDIKKGRYFGSKGDLEASMILEKEFEDNCSLSNARRVKLGPLEEFPDRYYTSLIEATSYNLTIHNPAWEREIPENDVYPIVSVWPKNCEDTLDTTFEFDETRVLNFSFFKGNVESWPFGGTVTGNYYNISYNETNFDTSMIGNATYIDTNDSIPEDQFGRIFLIAEAEGCD